MSARKVVTLVLLVAAVTLGVSGSAFAASNQRISPSFVHKANHACAVFKAALKLSHHGTKFPSSFDFTKPQPHVIAKVGQYYEQDVPVDKSLPHRLRVLGEPAKGKKTWNKVREDANLYERTFVDVAKDAMSGKVTAFVSALAKVRGVEAKIYSQLGAGGFTVSSSCESLFG
jgi:hypothetical protein